MKKIVGLLTVLFLLTLTVNAQDATLTDIAYYDVNSNMYEESSSKVQLKEGVYYSENEEPFNGMYIAKDNGQVTQEFSIKNGKENGKVSFYYPEGEPMEVGFFVDGERDGKWVKWSENGTKISEAAYKNGKKDGSWIIWDEAGNKLFEMNYSIGKKVGTWKSWNKEGELINEKEY